MGDWRDMDCTSLVAFTKRVTCVKCFYEARKAKIMHVSLPELIRLYRRAT